MDYGTSRHLGENSSGSGLHVAITQEPGHGQLPQGQESLLGSPDSGKWVSAAMATGHHRERDTWPLPPWVPLTPKSELHILGQYWPGSIGKMGRGFSPTCLPYSLADTVLAGPRGGLRVEMPAQVLGLTAGTRGSAAHREPGASATRQPSGSLSKSHLQKEAE